MYMYMFVGLLCTCTCLWACYVHVCGPAMYMYMFVGPLCTAFQGCVPGSLQLRQVYIGETVRRLETRMKEHQDACRRGMVERSAIAEHAWENQHPIKWEETEIVDQARRPKELLLKEALHIQMTPAEERFNRDAGLELPGCWTATLRRLQGGAGSGRPLTSRDVF